MDKFLTNETNDLSVLLKTMLKLNTMVIVTEECDANEQHLYVVGCKNTVVYNFCNANFCDMTVKPYSMKATPATNNWVDLLKMLSETKSRITIYNQ